MTVLSRVSLRVSWGFSKIPKGSRQQEIVYTLGPQASTNSEPTIMVHGPLCAFRILSNKRMKNGAAHVGVSEN